MTIAKTLENYGFVARENNVLYFGVGSLVWGHIFYIKPIGKNLYIVKYHSWYYNCDGDCEYDETTTETLYGAQVLEKVFNTKIMWLFR